ncbi:hypothetical protein EVAR_51628_1 [Eumeta japonica]|uniref:Uncharacterized protein n=1 Tax=Eumeta variegata TaxID=151549 RepID=A0A4C1YGQ4_EUMVA|nr:hypothetical protein EVAR_51628_1 [Eumeta japonica]
MENRIRVETEYETGIRIKSVTGTEIRNSTTIKSENEIEIDSILKEIKKSGGRTGTVRGGRSTTDVPGLSCVAPPAGGTRETHDDAVLLNACGRVTMLCVSGAFTKQVAPNASHRKPRPCTLKTRTIFIGISRSTSPAFNVPFGAHVRRHPAANSSEVCAGVEISARKASRFSRKRVDLSRPRFVRLPHYDGP